MSDQFWCLWPYARPFPTCNPVQNKEDMLAAAGFTLVPANTPQRQASLTSLPPHKFIHHGARNNAVVFIYADPTICDCLYVGNQAAYDRYRQNVFAQNIANEQQMTAQINELNWAGGADLAAPGENRITNGARPPDVADRAAAESRDGPAARPIACGMPRCT